MSELAGKTVLITGASRGIGAASARQFAALGAKVGLVARDSRLLGELAAELGERSHAVAADVAEPSECARAVDEVTAALGAIDVLVSCAGVLQRDFVEDVKPADFELNWRVHVGGALWLTQRLLPGMRERGYGRIVLVSSELGLIGGPSYASYCTSKWGLVGLGEVLHHELAGSGVRACVLCPADVQTAQLRCDIEWGQTGGASFDKAMSPDHVARAIVRAVSGRAPLVVVDRPHLRAAFKLLGGPRGLARTMVHGAFKPLLKSRADAGGS
ncbi:MAG TPA: SDR family oxidoreductase [Solirubrobacteraceae bacterium]|nr:SDR family oxidoreductase [Solirubrobacteraceae bacterium]